MRTKILWLSRHPMTRDQARLLGSPEVVTLNVTYPAHSFDAVRLIVDLCEEHGTRSVAGVFPAHVAIALSRQTGYDLHEVMIPVSIPSAAADGETRGGGFVFSHWEQF